MCGSRYRSGQSWILIRCYSELTNATSYLRQLEQHLSQSHGLRPASDSRDEALAESSYAGHDIDEPTPNAAPFLLDDQPTQGIDTVFHLPETPRQQRGQTGSDPDIEDGHRSRFSRNPLVDKNPSFAKTPDGRFCE